MMRRDAAGVPRLTVRGVAARSRAQEWLATHGPGLVVLMALAALALLTGAGHEPGAEWLSTGGVGAALGSLVTFVGTYRARQAQAARIEARAAEAAQRTHQAAYDALGEALEIVRGELRTMRSDLAAARSEGQQARVEAERLRDELESAEREIGKLRAQARTVAKAFNAIDERTRPHGSITPAEGHRILEDSGPDQKR